MVSNSQKCYGKNEKDVQHDRWIVFYSRKWLKETQLIMSGPRFNTKLPFSCIGINYYLPSTIFAISGKLKWLTISILYIRKASLNHSYPSLALPYIHSKESEFSTSINSCILIKHPRTAMVWNKFKKFLLDLCRTKEDVYLKE